MRISDWSSDVCSSDLALGDRIADTRFGHRIRWLERVDLVERRMEHRRLPGIVDTGKGVGTEDLPVILRGQRDLVFWRLGQPVAHEESLSLRDRRGLGDLAVDIPPCRVQHEPLDRANGE